MKKEFYCFYFSIVTQISKLKSKRERDRLFNSISNFIVLKRRENESINLFYKEKLL